jgi:hypothetical protein
MVLETPILGRIFGYSPVTAGSLTDERISNYSIMSMKILAK